MHTKKRLIRRIKQLQIILEVPGALKARLHGCHLEIFKMLRDLRSIGLQPRTILDIGANRGIFTKCAHYIYPQARLLAFEPVKECYQELCKLQNQLTGLECFNVALGDAPGEATMHVSKYDYSSSLLQMGKLHKEAFPYSEEGTSQIVALDTLDNIMAGREFQRPMLIKIDVQGYEGAVLDGAMKTLDRTDFVVCEMSMSTLYDGQPLFHEIYQKLIRAGFTFKGPVGAVEHPQTKETLQVDGFFVRA